MAIGRRVHLALQRRPAARRTSPVASSITVATPSLTRAMATRPAEALDRRQPRFSSSLMRWADRESRGRLPLFFRRAPPYKAAHDTNFRPRRPRRGLAQRQSGRAVGPGRRRRRRRRRGGEGPRNPWGPRRRKPSAPAAAAAPAAPARSTNCCAKGRERFGGGFPQRRPALLALRPGRLPRALDPLHQLLADRPAGARRRHHVRLLFAARSARRRLFPALSVRQRDQARRRGDPHRSRSPAAASRISILTGDQNIIDLAYSVRWNISSPEHYAFQIADPETTIKRGRRKRDARGGRARVARRRDRRRPRRHRAAGPAEHAAIARRLWRRGPGPGRRDQPVGAAREGQRRLSRSLGGAAARAERDEQCPLLCAAAHRARPGRGGGVREGLCRISRSPRR